MLLRRLRTAAGLTQEELAEAAGLSARSISDLERGINQTARKDTARLLADALGLEDETRRAFEAAARGRTPVPGPRAATATRTLPRDIASFTGREVELARLLEAAVGGASRGSVIGIHAIGGMAGIGKTTLAVHAAHRLADRFPDGQFFLPLHAHTPGQPPVDPADALASLLLAAGVPPGQILDGMEARMARWRDHLAGKLLLLVLDDASGHEQAFVINQAHGTWGKAQEVPGTAGLNTGGGAYVNSLSCASAGNCAAVGSYADSSGLAQVFVVNEKGGSWGDAEEIPGTAALNTGDASVDEVSCGAAGNCAATGYYVATGDVDEAFVVSQAGGTWSDAEQVPGVSALGSTSFGHDVSCPSANHCAALPSRKL